MTLYFTSELRINRKGEKTLVFIVSNYDTLAKSHVEAYRLRWCIEKFFRTAKQNLGFQYCSARSIRRQEAHIYGVFLSYAFLQIKCLQNKFPNIETTLKHIIHLKSSEDVLLYDRFRQFFVAFA